MALVMDVHDRFVEVLGEKLGILTGQSVELTFKGGVLTDDIEAVNAQTSPALAVILFEDALSSLSLGNSYTLHIRLGIKVYVAQEPTAASPAAIRANARQTKEKLVELTELVRKSLMRMHGGVPAPNNWRQMDFDNPLTSYHRVGNARWSVTVVELLVTERF